MEKEGMRNTSAFLKYLEGCYIVKSNETSAMLLPQWVQALGRQSVIHCEEDYSIRMWRVVSLGSALLHHLCH